jgi:tetratricopeptide (TPR) repeat protein
MAYSQKGLPQQALDDYSRAIGLDSHSATSYANRCAVYIRPGDFARAIVDCSRAIKLDPDIIIGYINRGYAYLKQKNYTLNCCVARFA